MWRLCTYKSLSAHNFIERQCDTLHFFLSCFALFLLHHSAKCHLQSICICTNSTLCVRKILRNQLGKFHWTAHGRVGAGRPNTAGPPGNQCLLMHSPNDKSADRRRWREERPGTWRRCPFNFLLIYGQDGCVCAASLILAAREAWDRPDWRR